MAESFNETSGLLELAKVLDNIRHLEMWFTGVSNEMFSTVSSQVFVEIDADGNGTIDREELPDLRLTSTDHE